MYCSIRMLPCAIFILAAATPLAASPSTVGAPQARARAAAAPHSLHVNHEGSEALAVPPGMVLGWALPPTAEQHSFRLKLTGGQGSSMGEFGCERGLRGGISHTQE